MDRYRVNRDAEIAGMYRRAGEVITLTPPQARHLAPPLASVVTKLDPMDHNGDGEMGGSPPGGLRARRRKRGRDDG